MHGVVAITQGDRVVLVGVYLVQAVASNQLAVWRKEKYVIAIAGGNVIG